MTPSNRRFSPSFQVQIPMCATWTTQHASGAHMAYMSKRTLARHLLLFSIFGVHGVHQTQNTMRANGVHCGAHGKEEDR